MILYLQILTSFSVILWFDFIGGHRFTLKLFGFKPWTTKADIKPLFVFRVLGKNFTFAPLRVFACYFCTSFWIGVIIAGAFAWITQDFNASIILIMSNTIASRLLDYLLGYQSFKSK